MSKDRNEELKRRIKRLDDELSDIKKSLADPDLPGCTSAPLILLGAAVAMILSSLLVVLLKLEQPERLDFFGYLLPLLAGAIGGLGLYRKSVEVGFFWASFSILVAGLCFYMASKGVGEDVLYMFVSMASIVFTVLLICSNASLLEPSIYDKWLRWFYYLLMGLSIFVFGRYFALVLSAPKEERTLHAEICQIKLDSPASIIIRDKTIKVAPATLIISTRDVGPDPLRTSYTPCATFSYSIK